MKKKYLAQVLLVSMFWLASCGGYETRVINTVHADGSITRKVIMKNDTPEFLPENFRVPVDSTWTTSTVFKINENQDTTWIYTAEKHFNNTGEINLEYRNDSGANSRLSREAHFSKKFKWFNTIFRFSEVIDQVLTVDCKPSEFLSDEELSYMYLPGEIQDELLAGPDSIYYKTMADTLETKFDRWLLTGLVREWIKSFYDLFGSHPDLKISQEEMLGKESRLVEEFIVDDVDEEEVVKNVLGEEFYARFETEIDSAFSVMDEQLSPFWNAREYTMEIHMPGEITGSSGYVRSFDEGQDKKGIVWAVQGDFFLGQSYEMWVESKMINAWAWIVTGIFILFVTTGFIIRFKRRPGPTS